MSERMLTSVMYGCEDCDWPPGPGEGNNGVGLAAQHAQANPGHRVWADETWSRRWGDW